MYKLFLSFRYLKKPLSLVSIVVLGLSVMALVAVPSVMNGFQYEFHLRVRGTQSDLSIVTRRPLVLERIPHVEEKLASVQGVVGVAPNIEYPAIDRHFEKADWCFIRAVVPSLEEKVGDFRSYVLSDYDRYLAINEFDTAKPEEKKGILAIAEGLNRKPDPDTVYRDLEQGAPDPDNPGKTLPGIVPGIFFLHAFQLNVGDVVKLTTATEGGEVKQDARFVIVGGIRSGTSHTDRRFVYMSLKTAQDFIGVKNRISGYSIKLADYKQIKLRRSIKEPESTRDRVYEAILDLMQERVPETDRAYLPSSGIRLMSWEERDENLLKAVAMERLLIKLITLCIVIAAAASVFFFLLMEVLMKVREIGILRAIGGTWDGVLTIFLGKGLLLAMLGMILGTVLGLAFAYNINWLADRVHDLTGWHPFPPDVYYLEKIPARVEWPEVVINWVIVMFLGVIFAFPPALIAALRPPIRAIRYE
ncbi:FtsX-like permease family protein [bacterium]|nr:FtsX-like permease family protein [bacterium]